MKKFLKFTIDFNDEKMVVLDEKGWHAFGTARLYDRLYFLFTGNLLIRFKNEHNMPWREATKKV